MKKVNNCNGITTVSLVITVVLMMIILSVITFSATSSLEIHNLNNMYTDIRILEEKISIYYSKYRSLPVIGEAMSFENSINDNDEVNKYYEIDLSLLEGLSLNNMRNDSTPYDIYIINGRSHTIYYMRGVKTKEDTYYTIPLNYEYVDLTEYQGV